MASLYEISNDILRIFNEVESNEGEITDVQYDALVIKQEELKIKLEAYVKAIKSWEADEKALKEEKKRFNDRQKVFSNRIGRLKEAALEAVINFGEEGKNNKFIELPNFRIFTKKSKAIVVNEERVEILIRILKDFIIEIVKAGVLYSEEDVDLQGILNVINANAIAEFGENFELFTIADLTTLKLNVSTTATVYELFRQHKNALTEFGESNINCDITNATTLENWKTIIDINIENNISLPTIAKQEIRNNLQIK